MGDIIVGIDIGTTKVCTVIGRIQRSGEVEVLGKGLAPCTGVKKGVIVDMDKASSAVRASVEQAEAMANLKTGSAYINIIGMHVNVINKRSIINISNDDREITRKDVERLFHTLKDIELDEDRQIIDIIPRQFVIDGYDEIVDPVGMVGTRLEVDADIIAGKITSVQSSVKSLERAGLKTDGMVVSTYAAAEMVLLPDEKELGAILIDVGGGVTDLSVFIGGRLLYYNSVPVGGDHITNDISIGLKITPVEAEKLKKEYELALTTLIKNDQEVTVFDVNENKKKNIKVSEVVEIIEARVYEIFSICKTMLQKEGVNLNQLEAGIVLTGGGISYVDGNKQLAAEVFELPVRVASWKHAGGVIPEMIVAEGMIKYISSVRKGNIGSDVKTIAQNNKSTRKNKSEGLFDKVRRLFDSLF